MEKFTSLKIGKINEYAANAEDANAGSPFRTNPSLAIDNGETLETKSEPAKFVSKLFESRQMAHVFHLQASGDGAYAEHMALDLFYNGILTFIDLFVEVYSGQYEIIENYEIIEGKPSAENSIQYFVELAQFIKDTRQIAFLPEDTHLQNIIDEMVSLTYKTLYKLRCLK